MLTQAKQAQLKKLRVSQVIALFYSIIFVSLIAGGYFLLLQKNYFVAFVASIVLAGIAWNIARYLGAEENGIRRHPPLFLVLLIVSAVGVFNNLMLNLEGRKIFQETLETAEQRYIKLGVAAKAHVENPAIAIRISKVQGLTETLVKEIINPRNCGQGPEAIDIIEQIRKELPDFRRLTGKANDCSKNEQIATDYKSTIPELLHKSQWYTEADYDALLETRARLVGNAEAARLKIRTLRGEVNTGYAIVLLKSVAPKLEDLGSIYRDDVQQLQRYSPGEDVPPSLDLSSVENLGEWSQLVNLLFSRLDRPPTYVYLGLAIFLDWVMVYLFALIRRNSAGLPSRSMSDANATSPWKARTP